MKTHCRRCEQPFTAENPAYICPYQTTFCRECARALDHTCPECFGHLEPRTANVS